ncbi:MAG: 30S ribosomal protein S6 [bacterium]|nr:30S ribosomal protein S6 [bacterium]
MQYELVAIIPLLSEEELKQVSGKIGNVIQEAGGRMGENKVIARGRLAYSVKTTKQGQHWSAFFEIESDKLEEMKKKLRLMGEVVRFTVNKMIKMPKPAPVKEKEKTENRGWTLRAETPLAEAKEETATKETPVPEKTSQASLEELDKKLNEILGGSI